MVTEIIALVFAGISAISTIVIGVITLKVKNGVKEISDRSPLPIDDHLMGKNKDLVSLYEQLHKKIVNSCQKAERYATGSYIAYKKNSKRFIDSIEICKKYITVYLPFEPVGKFSAISIQGPKPNGQFSFRLADKSQISEAIKAIEFSYGDKQ